MLVAAFAAFLALEYFLFDSVTPHYQRFLSYLALATLILVGTRLHAYLIDRRLRRQLGDPLSALAESLRALGQGRGLAQRLPASEAVELSLIHI